MQVRSTLCTDLLAQKNNLILNFHVVKGPRGGGPLGDLGSTKEDLGVLGVTWLPASLELPPFTNLLTEGCLSRRKALAYSAVNNYRQSEAS